ncbi:NAD(P)-binding domain-containing protein [Pseudonocardia sp.]|uniref:NAD(P)-binding domain-containing protein n=1 Tax=Pseudonocardia sp. TaxID=60912 RepID=UPI00260DCE36|nr:NAD(P)-binding domain-containing protein [Pseudonocardia sp.]
MTDPQDVDTVVIGGGQAGLAVGFHLRRCGRAFVVLDADSEIGGSWRRRWDSLRLFTPAGFSHLPGMPFPADRRESPTKDAMADYLAAYARRFALPVELSTVVVAVDRAGADLRVVATDGRAWQARDVVVATGAHGRHHVPDLAADIDPAVLQVHSGQYRRPEQLPTGPVLVVGAGNSGAEIAVDLASPDRQVYLAGRDVGHVPPLGTWTYPLMRGLGRPGSTLARRGLRGGAEPLGRIRPGDLEAAGVRRVPRVAGTRDGLPLLADGRTLRVAGVVWCTGFRPDHRFVRLPVRDDAGGLIHHRGVTGAPGLYVVGMPHQSSITSHLVGGVGADARFVVDHLAGRPATTAPLATVYTRDGCGRCARLVRGLRRRGVSFAQVDIGRAPGAADAVRAGAGGDATAPTVEIGDRWLVAPSAREVVTTAGG